VIRPEEIPLIVDRESAANGGETGSGDARSLNRPSSSDRQDRHDCERTALGGGTGRRRLANEERRERIERRPSREA